MQAGFFSRDPESKRSAEVAAAWPTMAGETLTKFVCAPNVKVQIPI